MSRKLRNTLECLFIRRSTWQTEKFTEDLTVLVEKYTEKDLQEAVLEKDDDGELPIHIAWRNNAPVEVIQLLLDSDTGKKKIFEKNNDGWLPIHLAIFGINL
jgi:hypothetical protein